MSEKSSGGDKIVTYVYSQCVNMGEAHRDRYNILSMCIIKIYFTWKTAELKFTRSIMYSPKHSKWLSLTLQMWYIIDTTVTVIHNYAVNICFLVTKPTVTLPLCLVMPFPLYERTMKFCMQQLPCLVSLEEAIHTALIWLLVAVDWSILVASSWFIWY